MYGRAFGWFHAAVSSSSLSGIIAAELIGTGVAIYTLSGGAVQLNLAVVIAFVFALLYIFFGGFLQMAWINIVNSIMLIVGSFAAIIGMVIWVGKNVAGGLDGILEFYANSEMGAGYVNQYTNILKPDTLLSIFIPVTLLHLCSITVSQGHNMPFFAAKSSRDIRKGVYLASAINVMSAVPWVLIGVVAFALPSILNTIAPEDVGKLIVPTAALAMLPKPLTGLLMISLLSATLSTAGAITLGSAQQITTNIIKDALYPKMTDKQQLWITRIMCIVYSVICLVMALKLPVVMPVFFFCFMLSIPLFFCYITGMFITINKVTCYITLLGGYIVAFWWTFAPPAWAPFPLSDTTWAVVVVSAILGVLLPLAVKSKGSMPLKQVIKASRGQAEARLAD
jgi:SSS family solute:Na+ symporter